ncbi:MAG: putative Ig domain-containing protein [Woeseia sp.]
MSAQVRRNIGHACVVLCVQLLLTGCSGGSDSSSSVDAATDNHAPTITGSPERQVATGKVYDFRPSADDNDGDELSFKIANLPAWANFNRNTGVLSGVPAADDVGQYSGIVISVSDGKDESSLSAFGLNVEEDEVSSSKSNPGHYITMNRFDNERDLLEAVQQTGVRGIQKRYYWKELEPSFGNYDFSSVLEDLELVQSQGKMLVVFVEDKTFNGENPAPAYLQSNFTAENRHGGYTAIRWAPYVALRFSLLLEALGQSLDSHSALEGVAIQESALSFDDSTLEAFGYSPEAYRDALIDVLTIASQEFSTSQVFWYMNFLPQNQNYLNDIAIAVAPYGIAIGGPDVLPDSAPLVTLTYPLYDNFPAGTTLFNSIQYDSYSHRHEDQSSATMYWTMDELFEFARDDLHVDYLFWTRKVARDPADSYMWFDALPVIQRSPTFNASSL